MATEVASNESVASARSAELEPGSAGVGCSGCVGAASQLHAPPVMLQTGSITGLPQQLTVSTILQQPMASDIEASEAGAPTACSARGCQTSIRMSRSRAISRYYIGRSRIYSTSKTLGNEFLLTSQVRITKPSPDGLNFVSAASL